MDKKDLLDVVWMDCIEKYDPRDYLLSDILTLLEKLDQSPKQDDEIYSYDQHAQAETKSACTLYGPLSTVTSLYNVKATKEMIMDLWNFATVNYKYKVGQWMYFQTWVKCVMDRWNKRNPDKKIVYYKSSWKSWEFDKVLDKWYWIVVGYKWNQDYNTDRRDWVLDWVDFQPTTYGHCTTLYKLNGEYTVADSSAVVPRYKIKKENIQKVKNFYSSFYVYLPEKTVWPEEVFIRAMMSKNGEERGKTSSQKYKKLLNDINNLCRDYMWEPRK